MVDALRATHIQWPADGPHPAGVLSRARGAELTCAARGAIQGPRYRRELTSVLSWKGCQQVSSLFATWYTTERCARIRSLSLKHPMSQREGGVRNQGSIPSVYERKAYSSQILLSLQHGVSQRGGAKPPKNNPTNFRCWHIRWAYYVGSVEGRWHLRWREKGVGTTQNSRRPRRIQTNPCSVLKDADTWGGVRRA